MTSYADILKNKKEPENESVISELKQEDLIPIFTSKLKFPQAGNSLNKKSYNIWKNEYYIYLQEMYELFCEYLGGYNPDLNFREDFFWMIYNCSSGL